MINEVRIISILGFFFLQRMKQMDLSGLYKVQIKEEDFPLHCLSLFYGGGGKWEKRIAAISLIKSV